LPQPSGAIGKIYDVSVKIAPTFQVAGTKDAVITFSFSLPLPLTKGSKIIIWVPANYIEKINPVRSLHSNVAFPSRFFFCNVSHLFPLTSDPELVA
jgi:hypothetical protein